MSDEDQKKTQPEETAEKQPAPAENEAAPSPEAENTAQPEAAPAPEAQTEKTEAPKAEAKDSEAKAEAKDSEAKPEAESKKAEAPKAEAKDSEAKPKEKSKKEAAPKAEAKDGEPKPKAQSQEDEAAPEKKEQPSAADLLKADLGDVKIRRAKGSKNITAGVVHILATFNNTKVTFTDRQGNVISWSSAGKMNFRGSRKSTAYAAQVVTQDAGRSAMSHGLKEVEVHVRGPGMGRDSAIRALQALGLIVTAIVDATPVPHNGCRPPKRRRV